MTPPVEDTGSRCLECDYNLTGVVGARCPECGWEIDRSLVGLVRDRPPVVVQRMMLAALCGLVGVAAVLFVLGGWIHWSNVGVPKGPSRVGLTGVLLGVSTVVCGGLHLVLLFVLRLARSWPVVNPTLARICYTTAAAQVLAAAVFGIETFGARPFGLVGFVVVFAVLSAVGWVLLFVTSIGLGTKQEVVRRLRARVADGGPSAGRPVGAPFVVQVIGRFGAADVSAAWSDVTRSTDATIESAIDAAWRDKERAAAARNQDLYNGQLGRLIEATVMDGGKLALTLGATDYRDFVGTNLYNGHLHATFGDAFFSNPLGTSATVISRDGYLVYGRRSDRVMYHGGCLHTFGGTLEPADRDDARRYDVFAAIRRELREELGVADEEIGELVCTGLVRDRQINQPELLFDAHVRVGRRELLSRFDAATDEEHVGFEMCHDEPEAIVPFIERSAPMVPVAVAGMLLHGRYCFGVDWFESACYVLFGDLPVCLGP